MKTTKLKFENREGRKLSARLEKPVNSKAKAYILFAHCFTCGKNLKAVGNISRALTSQGYAVFRFDFTGLGESEGDFGDTDFSSNIKDLEDAAAFLENNYEAPSVIIGHSLGGSAALIAAADIESIKAVVTIGAPYKPDHVKKLLGDDIDKINKEGKASVDIGGRPFTIKKEFLDDLGNAYEEESISELKKPLLILHSPNDMIVPIENAAEIYKAAFHPKSFVSLDDSDHLMSNKEDSVYVGSVIAAWAGKYTPAIDEPQVESKKQVAVRTGSEGYTSDIKAGNHILTGDEPEKFGGKDLGPTPYDFFLTALGTCTGMTLRMYADKKGWDVREINVHLAHERTHAEDCSSCEDDESSKIDNIERVLEIEGELSEDQLDKLVEIAGKCPVARSMTSETKIKTRLKK